MFGFACTYGRSKVALCPPAVSYQPQYFFSLYPKETTKLWNLKNLLSPEVWLAYFMTIICVVFTLKLSVHLGRNLGLNTVTEEINLVPFRCLRKSILVIFGNLISLFRISLIENKTTRQIFFTNGFTSNFVHLLWATFGGFMM